MMWQRNQSVIGAQQRCSILTHNATNSHVYQELPRCFLRLITVNDTPLEST